MAVIDVAGFVADLKDHAVDHGFHVHDERHFVETYSLRQAWEVDLHPEEACGGPLDLHLALEVDPRALLVVRGRRARLRPTTTSRPTSFHVPADVHVVAAAAPRRRPTCWCWPPSWPASAARELPLEVSAIDSFPSVTDAPERSLDDRRHASRCRSPACTSARSSSATCSTAAAPSASTCSSGRPAWLDES